MRDKRSLIVEGLYDNRMILESSSVFATKLKSIMKDLSNDEQEFIKKALNLIYLGFKKDYGGYVEGKRPTVKDFGSFTVMTWKIQTLQTMNYKIYSILETLWKPLGVAVASLDIDGSHFMCVVKDLKPDDDMLKSNWAWKDNFKQDKSIIVGVDSVASPRFVTGALDKTIQGDTVKFVVSIPNKNVAIKMPENPFASKDGFSIGNEFSYASYDMNRQSISGGDKTDRYNEPRFYTTKKTNLAKAWNLVLLNFNKDTKMYDIEGLIDRAGGSTRSYCAMD